MRHIIKFFYSIFSVMLTGYICSAFTDMGLKRWYDGIEKPFLTPPNVIFPIVWSVLYILIAASTFIVLCEADSFHRKKINNIFILQLFLQILWSFIFFAQGHLGLGFAVILLLDICVFKMIALYSKVNKTVSYILYPYYWWLIFATFLNFNFIYNLGLIIVF